MSFVIYDVETTGLTKGFDQIVQFAALRTDAALKITDKFESCCRLMPHVIPSPEAMHATGLRIDRLIDSSLPSHFAMVAEIHRVLEYWRPALFLGFNSLSFDEEFLRQAFYQCLYGPYLTNTQGSARADVLNLCRITAALRPDVIKPAIAEDGRPLFRLKPLAEANAITVPLSHDAMADVATTLALCHRVSNLAPEIWSQFLRFSQKASVESFITEEDAFLVSETFGNHHRARIVTRIGRHSEQAIRHYCLDVSADVNDLRAMSDDELIAFCKGPARPIVALRTNAAPTLWALYDATRQHLAPFDEAEVLERISKLRDDRPLLDRLCKAAQASERIYPPSPYIEEQLYERGFPPPQDETLMLRFHAAPWEERLNLARQFTDERYRRLALRLVYLERPDLLGTLRQLYDEKVRKRVMAPTDEEVPWRSIPAALRGVEALIAAGLEGDALNSQLRYLDYLKGRADALALSMAG